MPPQQRAAPPPPPPPQVAAELRKVAAGLSDRERRKVPLPPPLSASTPCASLSRCRLVCTSCHAMVFLLPLPLSPPVCAPPDHTTSLPTLAPPSLPPLSRSPPSLPDVPDELSQPVSLPARFPVHLPSACPSLPVLPPTPLGPLFISKASLLSPSPPVHLSLLPPSPEVLCLPLDDTICLRVHGFLEIRLVPVPSHLFSGVFVLSSSCACLCCTALAFLSPAFHTKQLRG